MELKILFPFSIITMSWYVFMLGTSKKNLLLFHGDLSAYFNE